MGFDVLKKNEAFHRRVDGSGVDPVIRNVAGGDTEYSQAWKTGNGPNWIDRDGKVPKTNALGAYFRHNGDAKD